MRVRLPQTKLPRLIDSILSTCLLYQPPLLTEPPVCLQPPQRTSSFRLRLPISEAKKVRGERSLLSHARQLVWRRQLFHPSLPRRKRKAGSLHCRSNAASESLNPAAARDAISVSQLGYGALQGSVRSNASGSLTERAFRVLGRSNDRTARGGGGR